MSQITSPSPLLARERVLMRRSSKLNAIFMVANKAKSEAIRERRFHTAQVNEDREVRALALYDETRRRLARLRATP